MPDALRDRLRAHGYLPPDYDGPAEAQIEYRLSNGQHDLYPASWALPVAEVRCALEYFERTHQRPPFVIWHED